MVSCRAFMSSCLLALFLFSGLSVGAQTLNIQQTLESKYALTKPTADRSDIVTAGDVIVLQKDGLLMCAVTSGTPTTNNYKNGKISQGILNKRFGFSSYLGAAGNSSATRTFVAGEKFWITGIETRDDGVVFTLISDPINDTRYYSTLKIQYNKGQPPPAAEVATLAGQVFKVQPADNASGGDAKGGAAAAQPAAAPAAPPPPPMAAIPPPPPPADAPPVAPPTIKLGLTKDQVTAMFGQPTKVVKLATKEIDIYPDMKVTFVHDKVTDIQ